jgi:nicotinamide phosphoribosyltransferase
MINNQIRAVAEYATFKNLLLSNPTGIISLVSDTFDIWQVLTEFLPRLKDLILARDGKLVIRPDSGDPTHIMTGYYLQEWLDNGGTIETFDTEPAAKGVIRLLWDVFGGSLTSTGYKKLNPKVGAIYGDAITLERSDAIDTRMMDMGFATTNYVLGVGSYSLQHVTRDTHGFAQKATHVVVNGHDIEIFKDPITDTGSKKSARGLLVVLKDNDGQYYLKDRATWGEVNSSENCLKVIYRDGEFFNNTTLTEIRGRINELLEAN